jgi:N6-L-threonylcarbamoyladenine synthase
MILGIESSCDESALALFDPESGLKGEWVNSQVELHQDYGGIVPDLASREHLDNFPVLLNEVMQVWTPAKLDSIAVTSGPGLAGCLALGLSLAKAIGIACDIPVVGVNHLRGHAWSPFIGLHKKEPLVFAEELNKFLPHLGLIVSGGNTILFQIDALKQISILAETVDDAAGEALDKGAKLLGMPYPGGPLIEKRSANGDPSKYNFPRAFSNDQSRRFSFSGLKTSLRYQLEKMNDAEVEEEMPNLCASYQEAVIEALASKTQQVLKSNRFNSIGLSGGVSNNKSLRKRFEEIGIKKKLPVLIANPAHTGDNAAMIAFAAFVDPQHTIRENEKPLSFDPSWPLSEIATG